MADEDESIYGLIQEAAPEQAKQKMYRSKFSKQPAPVVGSTFTVAVKKDAALFGKSVKETVKPDQFLKRQDRTLSSPSKFTYTDAEQRKPGVPRRDERPIYGLKSNKNFLVSNALDTILAQPPAAKEDKAQLKYTTKEDYGKVPAYLHEVKQQIEQELEQIKQQETQELQSSTKMRVLSEEERQELLMSLKKKWERINSEYQAMTHNVVLDTIGKIRRKEQYEAELAQLEKDIQKVEKKFVYVVDDQ